MNSAWDAISELVRLTLIDDLQTVEDKETHRALRKVLRYYSSREQWEEYKDKYE